MTSHRFRAAALAGVAASFMCACSKPPADHTPSVPVELATVSTIAAPVSVTANGVVEPLQSVAVQPQVGGTLIAVEFHEGDDVAAGQELFRIDPRPYEAALRQAEAALARDQAQADNARRDAERYKVLVEKDYVTKAQADQAQATAEALQASVLADRAAVDNARINVGYTRVRAPIAGRSGRLLVRQGNVVRPNSEPLVVINQLRPILVRFPVTQHDFPALQRRAATGPMTVRVITADSGRIAEAGTLAFIDNAIDSLTGTVVAKARFANTTDGLWPGEYVRVIVELELRPDVIAVPSRALVAGQEGSYVFVVGDDNVAKVRPVAVGRSVGDMTTVDSGLVVGEHVVVDGQSRLVPGSRVDVKAQQAAGSPRGRGGAAITQAGR